MRRLAVNFSSSTEPRIYRVVKFADLATEWTPDLSLIALVENDDQKAKIDQLRHGGLAIGWIQCPSLEPGDIVNCQVNRSRALVLHRESDTHHSLLTTNRCNSYCLMCSQPPTPQADDWLVEEALSIVRHIRVSPKVLGLTGGEPLLLGSRLRVLLDAIAEWHPETRIEVLTNGRLFAYPEAASILPAPPSTSWLVPLYGPVDFLHDFVVQSPGAFDETIAGLLHLQEHKQPVQLRVVLIEPVLQHLPELCHFIGRNLPFVREVALMACEPIGFALANRDACQVDLLDWSATLEEATRALARYRVAHIFMNTPLCALPRTLWPAAHKSISDWKSVFAAGCDDCSVKSRCSGLFAWHESGWTPTKIRAITEEVPA